MSKLIVHDQSMVWGPEQTGTWSKVQGSFQNSKLVFGITKSIDSRCLAKW